jgi:hypothetical protein
MCFSEYPEMCISFYYQNKEPFQQACGNCQKIAMEWLLMVSWSLRVRQIMCLIRSLIRFNQRLRNCFVLLLCPLVTSSHYTSRLLLLCPFVTSSHYTYYSCPFVTSSHYTYYSCSFVTSSHYTYYSLSSCDVITLYLLLSVLLSRHHTILTTLCPLVTSSHYTYYSRQLNVCVFEFNKFILLN